MCEYEHLRGSRARRSRWRLIIGGRSSMLGLTAARYRHRARRAFTGVGSGDAGSAYLSGELGADDAFLGL